MDFGVVALEGLVSCSDNIHTNNNNIASFFPSPTITTTTAANSHSLVTTAATSTTTSSNPDPKPKWYGSGLFGKQERSVTSSEDDWRELKMPRTSDDDFSLSKAALSFQNSQRSYSASTSTTSTSLLRSNTSLHSDGQQMLSFSSPNSQTAPTVAYFPHTSSASYGRNTGYGSSSGFNASSMHGVKGPFTPSQWMELEHQALIYKYITANAPIPSNLLIPIRKALESAAFSTFPGAHIRHNPYGWGAFHMGFSGSSDPEPGRCRRTDGKKWRCSRDAVADQKYCERHMNRGRHRSRKPVEGQTGHSVSGGGPTNTTAKLMPMSSTASPAAVTAGSGASNSTLNHLHNNQLNGMQPGVPNLSASSQLNNRSFLNKGNVSQKNQENQYSILKQHNPSAELSRSEFGFVCSDSLLNPLHECTSSLLSSRSYGSSKDLSDREAKSQSSLRQFMDDWPHSDRTQLSISIPMAASSDFMSSTSSPSNEKLALSPLRLSRELDPTQMGLGMGARGNEASHRQANWIPISWETSMGGPLGEVLHSTNNSAGESTNASPLNLMTEGWDSSPRMALSSPTGVLQKTAFGSLSNSSAGSSPRTENNLLGSTLMKSTSSAAM